MFGSGASNSGFRLILLKYNFILYLALQLSVFTTLD